VVLASFTTACGGIGAKPEPVAAVPAGPEPAVLAEYGQALAALESGDEAAAERGFQALADAHPDYAGPLVNLALIRARRDATDEAVALLEQATAVCATCAPAWTELGVLHRRQGRFADAERAYLKAVEADPDYASARFNLGILYELYLQRPELALEQYERFRELQVEDPESGTVGKWVADLERRVRAVERSARSEDAS
jgi:tetratricopeptide (TPR) repeat protein